jgi:hypothetical protein
MADHLSPYTGAQIDEAARVALANLTPFVATLPAANWANTDVFGKRTSVAGGVLTFNTATYKAAVSNVATKKTFVYSTAAASWQLSGVNASLATYGLALTGTPVNGDVIVVEYAVIKAQTITVNGISSDHKYSVDLYFLEDAVPSEMAAQSAAWYILRYLVGTNSITFQCAGVAPTVDLPVQIWEA